MFLGHFAVGLAAKRLSPSTPLPVLLIAGQLTDLIWPVLLLLGIEHARVSPGDTAVTPLEFISYPYSHSLVMVVVWALAFGLLVAALRKDRRALWVVAGGVLSHWALDALSHRPDMPLTPWSDAKVGLGLWHSVPGTMLVEGTLMAAGVAVYAKTTRALDRTGSLGLAAFVAALVLTYAAAVFGPPPPSMTAVAVSANALWLFMLWAWRLERHRAVV